jgi:hypothetical protein
METAVQKSSGETARRLSYCEVNASDSNNLRLGAGPPGEILSLPDEMTNIRFFMLEPQEGASLRARWYKGEIDEEGKLTTHPFVHPSQQAGAWGGFILPLIPLAGRIAQGIGAGGFLETVLDGRNTWVRVSPKGLAVTGIPQAPTLDSLLEDQPEARWWPVYVRLYGDTATLTTLLGMLEKEYVPPLVGEEPDP